MFNRSARLILVATALASSTGCAVVAKPAPNGVPVVETDAHGNKREYTLPAAPACQSAPCVTLNANELNVLGPIVGGRFQALQQEVQNLGAVIQDIQRQTAPQPAKPAGK